MSRLEQFLKTALIKVGLGVILLLHLWAGLALYFWFGSRPLLGVAVAAGYLVLVGMACRLGKSWRHGLVASLVLFLTVATWWVRRVPELGLLYPQETEQAAKVEMGGSEITVHAMRDFRYRSLTEYEARWATRSYPLDELMHVDLAFSYWGVPQVAHVITCFVFKNQPPLAVSIERRVERGEPNTMVHGFFKQYELFYLWGDERDLLALRTTARGERVRLYRTTLPPEAGRRLLRAMAARSNVLLEVPEFYNTLTDNCTSVIARHVDDVMGHEVAWWRRPFLTGKYEKLGYDRGWILHSQPWEQHQAAAEINDRAKSAGSSPEFSKLIRTHLPATRGTAEEYPSQ